MEENIKSPEEFLTEFSKDLHDIYVEEMKRTFDAHDYEYRDLPWMSDEYMSEIVNIIGPTNINHFRLISIRWKHSSESSIYSNFSNRNGEFENIQQKQEKY